MAAADHDDVEPMHRAPLDELGCLFHVEQDLIEIRAMEHYRTDWVRPHFGAL
jgi:hypothetical protein